MSGAFDRRAGESFVTWFLRRIVEVLAKEPVLIHPSIAPEGFRDAGVLVPFWEEDSGVRVLLTLRTSHLSSHSGQISFPGGARDPADADLVETALRETREELGIPPEDVTILGRLDDAWSIHSYVVEPYVGWLARPPVLHPNPDEVERVIIADVERLLDPAVHRTEEFRKGDHSFTLHCFDYDGDAIWGLTGGILYALLQQLHGHELDPQATGLATLERFLASEDG